MRAVKPANTTPERVVRSLLFALGLRFRLHRKDLPGTPDIVLPKYRTVIFVHGCFWHRHTDCPATTIPKTRENFWMRKFADNVARDRRKEQELLQAGWSVITVWECEANNPTHLRAQLALRFRGGTTPPVKPADPLVR
jgi:DNA mismatch endonuclease, patch repair protein